MENPDTPSLPRDSPSTAAVTNFPHPPQIRNSQTKRPQPSTPQPTKLWNLRPNKKTQKRAADHSAKSTAPNRPRASTAPLRRQPREVGGADEDADVRRVLWRPPHPSSPAAMPPSPHRGEGTAIWVPPSEIGGFPTRPPSFSRTTEASTEGTAHAPVPAHKRQHQWGSSQSRSPQAGHSPAPYSKEEKGVHRGEPPMRVFRFLSARAERNAPGRAHPCPPAAQGDSKRGPPL